MMIYWSLMNVSTHSAPVHWMFFVFHTIHVKRLEIRHFWNTQTSLSPSTMPSHWDHIFLNVIFNVYISCMKEHRYRWMVEVCTCVVCRYLSCRQYLILQVSLSYQFSWMSVSGPYYNPRPRQRIPRDLAMCVTPSGQFYCSMCNTGASDEADFRLHLESKQHKSKVSEQRYRSEMENLGYT